MPVFQLNASTTPGRLRRASVWIVLAAVLQGLAGTAAVVQARGTIDAIGGRTVPAIIEAQKVHEALADADRSAANAFLSGNVESAALRRQYQQDMATADGEIEDVAEHNSLGSQATRELRVILQMLTDYAGLVEQARANNLQGFPVGATYLRTASETMHRRGDGILARVDALSALDSGTLTAENGTLLADLAPLAAFAASDVLLALLLVRTQVFLRSRFRRRRNPRMMGATGVLIGLMLVVGVQGVVTDHNLGLAQQQALPRMLDLWQARSLATDANGNESLSLISHGNGAAFDAAFRAEAAQLVDRPLTEGLVASAAAGSVRFGGVLGRALARARLPQERQALVAALRAYRDFVAIDAMIRARAAAYDQGGAVALALGTGPGQLQGVFGRLDAALAGAIDTDRAQFDGAIGHAEPSLAVGLGLPACSLVTALLAVWGVRPRLAEYR